MHYVFLFFTLFIHGVCLVFIDDSLQVLLLFPHLCPRPRVLRPLPTPVRVTHINPPHVASHHVHHSPRQTPLLTTASDIKSTGTLFDFQLTQGHLTLRQTWTQSWTVNTVGPQILTSIFAPLLLKSRNPRLLFVTSGLSALSGTENLAIPFNRPPTTNGWPKVPIPGAPAYRSSKTGLNMMMREWHRLLRNDGVKVWCLSPGYLATGLGGDKEINKKMGAGDAAVAGPFVRSVVEGSRDGDVGKVVTVDGVQGW